MWNPTYALLYHLVLPNSHFLPTTIRVVRDLVHRYKFLISDENEESNTPLHLACLEGHSEVVSVLLEAGADVEARNSSLWTPLDCASARGHVVCVHHLLDYDSPLDPLDKVRFGSSCDQSTC